MVMDLLTGETLAQRLARVHVVSLPELARIMVDVCSAVGSAHALGIIHCDLKPQNIFLAESTSGIDVKVLDFGIAKLTALEGDAAHSAASTDTGAILGTPHYMAPEQLFGEKDVDLRADIWALGVIFYEALSGTRPTQAANVGQIYKVVVTDAIVPLNKRAPHLPNAIVDLVTRMLSRDRTKRPCDVREVLAVLADFGVDPATLQTAPRQAIGRSIAPAVILASLLVFGVLGVRAWGRGDSRREATELPVASQSAPIPPRPLAEPSMPAALEDTSMPAIVPVLAPSVPPPPPVRPRSPSQARASAWATAPERGTNGALIVE
jgi:serine/threonine-protein kinase